MSNIQDNINQALGTSAVLLNLNPAVRDAAERKAEERILEKKEKVLEKKLPLYEKDHAALLNDPDFKKGKEFYDSLNEVFSENHEIARRRFELNPNEETYDEMKKSRDLIKRLKEVNSQYENNENPLVSRQRKAERALQDKKKAKEEQMKKVKGKIDINGMYNKLKSGEISQEEYNSWFAALPGSQPDDDREVWR